MWTLLPLPPSLPLLDYMRWGVKWAVRQLVPRHRLIPSTSIWSTEGV